MAEDKLDVQELIDLLRRAPTAPIPPNTIGSTAPDPSTGAATATTIGGARFDWTISLGQTLQALTMLGSVTAAAWHFSTSQADARRDIDNLIARVAIYGPKVEALQQSNNVQDERIQNLSTGVAEIRRGNAETNSILGTIREDLAGVRAKLGVERRTDIMPGDGRRGSPN